ncbi:MAG: CoA transferase [Pseudomonadota bacterium]|jgi:crotonobetainyl-CoA:carnitine CoA-transferase CaiB-like acyl-CoA transferase|nr:CoA transferase [Pseudomonadota bacterium]
MNVLQGHRIIEVGEGAASALARFLASLGARVLPGTPELLSADLHGASFLIDRRSTRQWSEASCPQADLLARHPQLIHVAITPFGPDAARAAWTGNELIVSALGGALGLTGDADRAPVKEALDACLFHTDMVAAAAMLAAHYERGRSGQGQQIDISAQEVTFSRGVNSILVWQFDRRKLRRTGGALGYGRATVRCIWRLKDGWCFHTLMTGRLGAPANQALSDWMDERGVDNPLHGTDWVRYDRSALQPDRRARWEAAIGAFFLTCTKSDIAVEGRRRGINAAVVCEPRDALADPHLQARGFWSEHDGVRLPGYFFKAHQSEPAGPSAPRRLSRPGPLAGVRVLDFSWALVGSITTKILGDLGADVIKVESATRPCLSRVDRQVSASSSDSLDDKPWFAHLNTSKRSLALDLKIPESREVIDPIVRWADVVVENFSPGTMSKLGLGYEEIARLHPGIVMVSGSVYGQDGPLAREWGVDGTGAALSGRTFLTGWPDRDPVIPSALPYGDVIVPYVMAAAVAAALQHRRESRRGAHLDVAMYEVCLQQTYEALLQTQTGPAPTRAGNADARRFHQAVYPASGEDRWIAISCQGRAEWLRLCALAGLTEDEPQRLEGALGAWTARQDAARLAEALQLQGIEAAPVQDIEDLMDGDAPLAARMPLVTLDHPLLGRFGHLRTPMHFSRTAPIPFRAPRLGEHSREIAVNIAGLAPQRVAELEAKGVIR